MMRILSLAVLISLYKAVYRSFSIRNAKSGSRDACLLSAAYSCDSIVNEVTTPNASDRYTNLPVANAVHATPSGLLYRRSCTYPKEVLLRCRPTLKRESNSPPLLPFMLCTRVSDSETSPTTETQFLVTANSASPAQQKDYLQSLLHFRAFRNNIFNDATWEEWNEEARKILGGAAILGSCEVAMEVYDTLTKVGVLPDGETFSILIETSLAGGDVKGAKFFLKRMSSAGFVPMKSLVDEVLRRIGSSNKSSGKMNRDAPEFVPSHPIQTPLLVFDTE